MHSDTSGGKATTKPKKTQQYEIKPKQQTNKHKRRRSHNRRQYNTDDGVHKNYNTLKYIYSTE